MDFHISFPKNGLMILLHIAFSKNGLKINYVDTSFP